MGSWKIRTFRTDTGARPVDDWLRDLDPDSRAAVIEVIDLLAEFGTGLGMPHVRPMGDGLFELRSRSKAGIQRVLYFHWFGRTFGLLHGFTKKSQATPAADLRLARARRDEWASRPGPTT